jgi:hypothetical protein
MEHGLATLGELLGRGIFTGIARIIIFAVLGAPVVAVLYLIMPKTRSSRREHVCDKDKT